MEKWKVCPLHIGYEVSDEGRVRNIKSGRVLRPGTMPRGHRSVALGRRNSQCVHKLVLLAFVGPAPAGHEARHLNGVPYDNRLKNLEWATRSENTRDKKRHAGQRGRLSIDQVEQIKRLLAKGQTHKDIAVQFGVSKSAISAISSGANHADVHL